MTFATPWGLLALLAIPAIIAIHLFRRRFPVRHVAGLFLWQAAQQKPTEGRKIDRLPITRSLILECLAAFALALILAGARISPAGISQHLVVLLDDSASMAAVNAQGQSARDRAIERVLEELDRLGSGARVSLVLSGERPSVLAGPAAFAIEARPALDRWKPEAPYHSLALGVRLARELAGRDGRLMIVSDTTPDARGYVDAAHALWAAVGEPLPNAAIVAADRTLIAGEGRATVSLAVANHSDSQARRRIVVSAGSKEVLTRDANLPPGLSSLKLPIPPGLPPIDVALSGDALARDNSVLLAEPRPRIVGIDNRLPEGRGRDALTHALEAVSGVTRAEAAHLVFVDGRELDRPVPSGVWIAGFGRAPGAWAATGDPRDLIGPFLLEKRNPLLLGVTLGGVVWTGTAPVAPDAVRPLVSAGDRVLIGTRAPASAGNDPVIFFNLDLERTNLIRSPDWPILISNLVEMRRKDLPGPERWNYRVGELVRVNLGRDPQAPLRLRAGAVERTLPPARQVEFIAPSPGGLLQILEGDEVLFELGVNFLDDEEADLRGLATADAGELTAAAGLRAESGPASDPLFWILLAIGGTAILANWCLLPQRRTS